MASLYRNRHRMKNKHIKTFFAPLINRYPEIDVDGIKAVDTASYEDIEIILVNDNPYFFRTNEQLYFTLHGILHYRPKHYYVIVDMGAIRFVTNGADIMAPGIVDADHNILADDLVWIADERHHKAIGIGQALISGEDMINNTKGKAIKNIHFVGDKIWNLPTINK